jgi:CRP-like cAMP-binding protein
VLSLAGLAVRAGAANWPVNVAARFPADGVAPSRTQALLAALPRDHFDRLLPHLSTVSMQQGLVLFEAGDEVDQVYFPQYGMLSLLAVLRDGKAIETATVGREGVVGAMAGLSLYKSLVRIVVQMPVACSKIAATHFRTVAAASEPVCNLCIRYNEVLLSQARVTAACNALHPRRDFAVGCCKARIGRPATPSR